jgi:pantetheine-phosphate adenylyltransferase
MTRIALYPGSFDPPTLGHADLIRRSLALSNHVVVAVAVNAAKQPLFTVPERLEMLRAVIGEDTRITLDSFDGLVADYARRIGATLLVRGLRAVGDFG